MNAQWPDHFLPGVVGAVSAPYISTYTFALEAWRRGLTVTFLEAGLRHYEISDDSGRRVRFHRASPEMNSAEAIELTDHKYDTIRHLQRAGVSTPKSELITTAETDIASLQAKAAVLGYPVVLKRLDGLMGQGVFTDISGPEELVKRYRALTEEMGLSEILLEPHVTGDDYRVLVIGGEVAGACLRIPANVVGDGIHTVDELISQKNRERRRNPFLAKGLIRKDAEVEDYIESYGLTSDSIPAEGRAIRLRGAANGSAGGDLEDETETLAEEVRHVALDAVKAVPDLFCCGVDVLFDSETRQAVIIELNAIPAIGANMYPTAGQGQDIPKLMIDKCFPESARSSGDHDRSLYFPMREIRGLLRSGLTQSVTLAPLPDHRFPVRRAYLLTDGQNLTRRRSETLQRIAKMLKVSGALRVHAEGRQLVIAGTERGVDRFVGRLNAMLGTSPTSVENWTGAVPFGFQVTA